MGMLKRWVLVGSRFRTFWCNFFVERTITEILHAFENIRGWAGYLVVGQIFGAGPD